MKKKVLVTGCEGQLVSDLVLRLHSTFKFDIQLYNREGCDVTDYKRLREIFEEYNPDIYIHGPSVHNVEHIGQDINKACEVNIGSLYQASLLCNEFDTTLINFSTNYVFDGKPNLSYSSFEGNPTHWPAEPINVYGISKIAGERIVSQTCKKYYNIRVSGVFGVKGSRAKNGDNFIYIILRTLKEKGTVDVVTDQTLNVTYTVDASKIINDILEQEPPYGVYHVVNKGIVTWYDVAKFVAESKGYPRIAVNPIETKDFYSNIGRPQHTALSLQDTERILGIEVPSWQSGIIRFLREIGEIK